MRREIILKEVESMTCEQVMNLAFNLKYLRKNKKFTQLELAVELNCSESFISNLESARYYNDISLFTLNKICSLFDVTIDQLLSKP